MNIAKTIAALQEKKRKAQDTIRWCEQAMISLIKLSPDKGETEAKPKVKRRPRKHGERAKCVVCKRGFLKYRKIQSTCGPRCGTKLSWINRRQREKAKTKATDEKVGKAKPTTLIKGDPLSAGH